MVYSADAVGMTSLNWLVNSPAGYVLTDAFGINNSGQIAAPAFMGVTPEPKVYALMLVGLLLVAFMAQRKKQVS
jgi:hypothetical protein